MISKDMTISDELRSITRWAKLGNLPALIKDLCSKEAKKGKTSHEIRFFEGSERKFYGSLGAAYQEMYKDITGPRYNPSKYPDLTENDLVHQVIKDLSDVTGLDIIFYSPPKFSANNTEQNQEVVKMYSSGASVIINVSWK